MNIQLPQSRNWTADEFLRWAQEREGKFELVDGRVVEIMIKVTRGHVRLATNLTVFLRIRLDPGVYDVGSADFGVRISDRGVRFPDVFVDRFGDGEANDIAARAPVLLAEVLSPSSHARDFGPKAVEYTALPTLAHYLVLSPEAPRLWAWNRDQDGAFGDPVLVEGAEAVLDLPVLDIALPLAEIYRGVA